MDQIETLKWIAVNGNPIGTEAESDYLKHKADPTFQSIAKDLAFNGNPIGRGDAKRAYNTYKDTVHLGTKEAPLPEATDADTVHLGTKEAPLPEATDADTVQGGVVFMHPTTKSKAEEYLKTMGKKDTPYEVPKADGMNMESGLPGEYSAQYPGTTLALMTAPITATTGFGGAVTTAGTSMAANALDQTSRKEPFDTREMLAAGVSGLALPVIVNTGAGIVKKAFGPITSRLAAYPEQLAIWAEDNDLLQTIHVDNQNAMRSINRNASNYIDELTNPINEEEILAQLPGSKLNARARAKAYQDAAVADELNAQMQLKAIKEHMRSSGEDADFDHHGLLQQKFENLLEPSDYQAAKYWESISTPYQELPKPAAPKGINFLGQYTGDEEALLSPRTWANKLVNSDNRLASFVGKSLVDNQYVPRLAMRAASVAPDITRAATIPLAANAPYHSLTIGAGAGLEAGSYLMNRVLGRKSE